MKTITTDIIHETDRQEALPGYSEDFPCIISRAELDKYPLRYVPWHWHQPVELFYVESGELEYHTPGGAACFAAGAGGLVNSGVIHMTRPHPGKGETVQLLHIFDPFFLADSRQGRIARRYVRPYVDSGVEILAFSPESDAHRELLDLLRASFSITEDREGYEFTLRAALSRIWMKMLEVFPPAQAQARDTYASESLKRMLGYIHAHYAGAISVADIAAAGLISERECYHLFRSRLHCSPNAYVTGHRLEKACALLRGGEASVTSVGQECGFGTSSHFGKLFSRRYGCSPRQYRRAWQDRDKTGR